MFFSEREVLSGGGKPPQIFLLMSIGLCFPFYRAVTGYVNSPANGAGMRANRTWAFLISWLESRLQSHQNLTEYGKVLTSNMPYTTAFAGQAIFFWICRMWDELVHLQALFQGAPYQLWALFWGVLEVAQKKEAQLLSTAGTFLAMPCTLEVYSSNACRLQFGWWDFCVVTTSVNTPLNDYQLSLPQ